MTTPAITVYPDGPLIVRGPLRLLDGRGAPIDVRRRTVALCRCGRSRLMPFCDATHRSAGYRDAEDGAEAAADGRPD